MTAGLHIAQCACGAVSVTAEGEPDIVSLCNCIACQRRTGSPFGVGVYFQREVVRLNGATKTFERKVEGSNRTVTNHFCPQCGSTVYWMADVRPNQIGIGLGHFGNPKFRPPHRSVWTEHKHDWITFPEAIPEFPKAAS